MDPLSISGRSAVVKSTDKPGKVPLMSDGRTVNTIIVGSGPAALMTARVLSGRQFVHDGGRCRNIQHQQLLKNGDPVYWYGFPESQTTRRGGTRAGNWFDSFRFLGGTGERVHCLKWRDTPERGEDWHLFGEQPPGGSWQTYRKDQMTVSPYSYMEFPDYPLDNWFADGNPHKWDTSYPGRRRILNSQLCPYFESYASSLDKSRMHIGHRVTSARKEGDYWNVKVRSLVDGEEQAVKCRNLVCAVGNSRRNLLGIPGEKSPYVSHSSRDAFGKIKPGEKLLVLGTGLSAADVIIHAWEQQCYVTHIVDGKTVREGEEHVSSYSRIGSSRVLFRLNNIEGYPGHQKLLRAIKNPETHADSYIQRKDWKLLAVNDGACELSTETEIIETHSFDHIAILIGSRPDISWLETGFTDKQLLGLEVFDSFTHEGIDSGIKGLFMAGGCAGEPFQRFILGQSVAVAETIKARKGKEKAAGSV